MNLTMQTIKKHIQINAPQDKVWSVLLEDNFTRRWYAAFSEGTHAITDWQLGSKAKFIDNTGDGMVGTVIENRPYEIISIAYDGFIIAGQEDYESEAAQALKGARETYRLTETNHVTQLAIESDMAAEYITSMSAAWDNALQKIKALAENNGKN